jgi:tetratricopeptide (TPR) repeat protein
VARFRLAFIPIAALIVALLSNGLAASKVADPRSVPGVSAAPTVQVPAAQVPAAPVPGADAGLGAGAVDTSDLDARIAFWQARIKANPSSDTQFQYLGELLALKGRETGDIAQYAMARETFEKAIRLYPGNVAARSDLAVNLVTLHQWSDAITQAKQILQSDLRALGAVAVIGDASLETGDLDTARAAFETLRQKADGPAVESRIAHLDFLTGKTADAIAILDAAAKDSANLNGSVEEQAFYHYSAGEYRFNTGDVAGADREYQAALDILPNYYLALAGRGRVAFAQGDIDRAIAAYRNAVAIIPKPELVAYLGDLYAVKGDGAAAEVRYKTVDFIVKLNEVQAQVFNREIALFQATHHRDTVHAVAIARAELETRRDIYGYDALAWALYNDGQISAALSPARQAVSLGTQDPKLLYHLGMIELGVGRTVDGKAHLRAALALNPAFDPLGATAARTALGQ